MLGSFGQSSSDRRATIDMEKRSYRISCLHFFPSGLDYIFLIISLEVILSFIFTGVKPKISTML